MNGLQHGGDLTAAIAQHGGTRADWLDLSTGINPVAWPVPPIDQAAWARLPEADAMNRLLNTARQSYGVHIDNSIVAAAGAQALIQTLPMLLEPGNVGILGWTYGEYEAQFSQHGHRVEQVDRLDQLIGADVAILANPNNPDGRSIVPDDIMRVAEHIPAVLIDEAFVDVAPDLSLVSLPLPDNVIVLRSFGKFFGLAGLRLGFAIATAGPAMALNAHLGPWPVSGPALQAGATALKDHAWITDTRRRLSRDAERLFQVLRQAGFEIVGGTDLFVTVAHERAAEWHERLARAHIWTRSFDYNDEWLRFGLPGAEADWLRLEEALTA